jgi:protein disulfide-isomerase A6
MTGGALNARDFVDFVEKKTQIMGVTPISFITGLTPFSMRRFVNSSYCSLVMFYMSFSMRSRSFLAPFREISRIFHPDGNVSVGSLACENFTSYCSTYNISSYPLLVLFQDGAPIRYEGLIYLPGVVEFVNGHCGTHRGNDGLLTDDIGTVPEADALIPSFLSSSDKPSVVDQMKQIPGASFYVRVMERYLAKGPEATEKDIQSMLEMMRSKQGSISKFDEMKQKFNIFLKFAPHLVPSSTPWPTPSPTPTAYPDDYEPMDDEYPEYGPEDDY